MDTSVPDPSELIRTLNDGLRRHFAGGLVMATQGVNDLPDSTRADVFRAVRSFDAFDAENDPHGEHDFGAVTVAGERFFWKIDCYDTELAWHSPDAADPAVTRRVMTIMRADEY